MGNVLYSFFCHKAQNLHTSDHPILLKFRQFVIIIVVKELQMVFWTSTCTVSKGNENIEELERKI